MSKRPPATTTRLDAIDVVAIDCQTTGASPAHGHLLEVAWARGRATGAVPHDVTSTLVALPHGATVPSRIERLTGIGAGEVATAPFPDEVWSRVSAAAASVPLVVAHYARFERSFLVDLHDRFGGGGAMPFELLCTHEIARRLLPGLPRRGLRAVAGRFGHVLEEAKRAAGHARATLVVWRGLVERLREIGVTTRADLDAWMEETPPATRGGREYAMPRERRLALPDEPGVYRMLGPGGELLYVGKATSLRRRVNGYFQKRRSGRARIPEMLTQAHDVDVTVTGSPLEAALLECHEIHERAPPYNTALRTRGDALWFATVGLDSVRDAPDADHRVGPFGRRETALALGELRGVLADETAPVDAIARALGLPEEARLDPEHALEGAALLRERVGTGADPLRVGALLWRERREAVEDDEEDDADAGAADDDEPGDADEDDADTETPGGFDRDLGVWIPGDAEQVASGLAVTALVGAHRIRRGRWLADLADATLTWRPPHDPDGAPRTLRLAFGRPSAEEVPAGRVDRLRGLDAAAAVRLRVLTTELRRLVSAGPEVELRLGARRLDRARLAARLEWV